MLDLPISSSDGEHIREVSLSQQRGEPQNIPAEPRVREIPSDSEKFGSLKGCMNSHINTKLAVISIEEVSVARVSEGSKREDPRESPHRFENIVSPYICICGLKQR